MIYSRNLTVAQEAAKKMARFGKTKFNTQTELFIFFEEIKYPFLRRNVSKKELMYMPVNYIPSIKYLIDRGVLVKTEIRGTKIQEWSNELNIKRIEYSVQNEYMANYLKGIQ